MSLTTSGDYRASADGLEKRSFRNNEELTRRTDRTARQKSDGQNSERALRLRDHEFPEDDLCPGGVRAARPYS